MPFLWPLRGRASAAASRTQFMMNEVDIMRDGPYVWSKVTGQVTSVRSAGNHLQQDDSRPLKLPLFVTVPMVSSPTDAAPPGPFPVCVLLNGFQARASYYAPLARRLASWGYVVLQYNAPALTIIPDAAEMPYLGEAVRWLQAASSGEAAQPTLQGRADLNRLVVAGHSRGGKLAALHFCSGSVAGLPIRSAFLIDPVDNTAYTPESAAYPSASKALRAAGRRFGVAAAGLIGSANPEGSNWRLFEAAAAPGSWRLLLQRAGHTTFMKPPTGVEACLLDRIFGGGPLSRDTAVSVTAAAMLGWFGQELAQQPSGKHQGGSRTAAASAGSTSSVQAAAHGLGMPLAAAGLREAAAATAASTPEADLVQHSTKPAAGGVGTLSGPALAAAFQHWVTAAGDEAGVEFMVKS
eukprot:GHRQ01000604.1.p1 GENE.GHRQ01000604.1~~GHRQ01000604.1.p1  ORF type:complete len:408 (+),score=121.30 GHRQ01000604.1:413-1636(+)